MYKFNYNQNGPVIKEFLSDESMDHISNKIKSQIYDFSGEDMNIDRTTLYTMMQSFYENIRGSYRTTHMNTYYSIEQIRNLQTPDIGIDTFDPCRTTLLITKFIEQLVKNYKILYTERSRSLRYNSNVTSTAYREIYGLANGDGIFSQNQASKAKRKIVSKGIIFN